jgi:hypothetical protein
VSSSDERDVAQPSPRPEDGALAGFSRLDVAGYILAFVLPPAGLVLGVILLRRPPTGTVKHGAWIIAISVIVGILFVAALIATSHGVGTSEPE